MTLWPLSLANRTLVILLGGLALVQASGLLIHALDRVELQRLAEGRSLGMRAVGLYRSVVEAPDPAAAAAALDAGPDARLVLQPASPRDEAAPARPELQRLIRPYLAFGQLPAADRPREVALRAVPGTRRLLVGMRLPDDRWVVLQAELPVPRPWHSATFLAAFVTMTLAAALLSVWAVRRLTRPVGTLARAAEALGRDVRAPALPEDGPSEVATAARAFNTMAARIRRFVDDRTFLLAAIGHDLRTPITRLKLRAEWMEDEEQRRKMLADLDELEAMVAATLAFGRESASGEPAVPLDLAVLLRTVVDEAGDARPALEVDYAGPERLVARGRPVALKRAFANLVGNALNYAGNATVTLAPPHDGTVQVLVEDRGPGVPDSELEGVFAPFRRLEASRNRETGGAGLGLPIARDILRAHGGDVVLANRPGGGLQVRVTMPA